MNGLKMCFKIFIKSSGPHGTLDFLPLTTVSTNVTLVTYQLFDFIRGLLSFHFSEIVDIPRIILKKKKIIFT